MTTSVVEAVDQAAIGEFAGRFIGMLNDTMLISMIGLGRRTGLFDALAKGPGTSDDIADRAGLNERYVREWLGALVTGGIAAYDPSAATYSLPPAAAACLTGRGPVPAPALTQLSILLTRYLEPVADAFRQGGGVPYSAYCPDFTGVMDGLSRDGYDRLLIDAWLPLVPGRQCREGPGEQRYLRGIRSHAASRGFARSNHGSLHYRPRCTRLTGMSTTRALSNVTVIPSQSMAHGCGYHRRRPIVCRDIRSVSAPSGHLATCHGGPVTRPQPTVLSRPKKRVPRWREPAGRNR